ncbi:MAG: GTP 3',8-cyclase MoaA [Spirochaetes bacterium]|nr:GTP 3',8-cyclase MoaA [Spirochaetota bacterium]
MENLNINKFRKIAPLTDGFARKLDYLRVSITDKCNLRCNYCMPAEGVEFLKHDEVLRNEEFIYFIDIFANLGVRKVRFTGGEPLLRKGFTDILTGTRDKHPDIELCITTNGILLDEVLDDLKRLNVRKLNISLDSMSRQGFLQIARRDYFDRVISNIEKTLEMDFFDVKINSVLHHDILKELNDFIEYFKNRNVTLRFIEKMPFPHLDNQKELNSDDLTAALEKIGRIERNNKEDTRVAVMYDLIYRNNKIKIGIIPPMTHCFCSQCNRLRLTCDGFLRTCLHSDTEYDLKTPYRMDMGDEAVEKIIKQAVLEKPKKHNFECDIYSGNVCSSITKNRTMSKIGG